MKKEGYFILFSLFLFPGLTVNSQIWDSLQNIRVVIGFATPPSSVTVTKAPLRYNKDFALSFQIDDGKKDIWSHGFPFFEGGVGPDSTYAGLTFTDGCGNALNFKMSAAIYSFAKPGGVLTDCHDPNGTYATTNVTWPELITMYRKSWGVANHGLTSDIATNIPYDIATNHRYIRLKMLPACSGGPNLRIFVNPNGKESYTQPAFGLNYLVCYREGYPFGKPSFNVVSSWDHHDIKMGRTNLYGTINLSAIVDDMASASVDGAHHWGSVFTHYITNGTFGYTYPVFKDHMRYIASRFGSQGLDNIWMATEEEILEYLLVKDSLIISQIVNDTLLEIRFAGKIPCDYRFYNSSLLVDADAVITSINFSGVQKATFNGIGTMHSLINLSWNGQIPIAPANDSCINAYPLQEVQDFEFTTTGATPDGPGACFTSPNVWFEYTPSLSGTAVISLCGSSYDTRLAVYTQGADCYQEGTLMACNDNFCGLSSQVTLQVVGGSKYKIEVGGGGIDSTGLGLLSIQLDVPANRTVQNMELTTGQEVCFDAVTHLMVREVTVDNGATISLIAGSSIIMTPVVKVFEGGYLSARITETADFCSHTRNELTGSQETLSLKESTAEPSPVTNFRVYPNPTEGLLNLESKARDLHQEIQLHLFNMMGELVLREVHQGQRRYTMNLTGIPAGIYNLQVSDGSDQTLLRVVRLE